jgi:RNA:NAD 2'-phosphotransferase (TPT1/KptA family)
MNENLNREQFRTVYHGVEDPNVLPNIQKEGLRPGRLPEVYTSHDFDTAAKFGTQHVLEVHVHPSEIISETPSVVTTGPIAPDRIVKVHERGESWPTALNRQVKMPASVRAALDKFKAENPGVIQDPR